MKQKKYIAIVGISIKNKAWSESPIPLLPSSVPVANIPENPVPVLKSATIILGYPLLNPRNTASPKLYEIPWNMLAKTATKKNIFLSAFMQEMAISKKDALVNIVTMPTLTMCLILTQQDPLTILLNTPKMIIKSKKRLKRCYSPKTSARSDAAA